MNLMTKLYKTGRRKILGKRGTKLVRSIVSTILTETSIVNSNREKKKEGISAMVISYNESDWIELSIKSISDIVDEFIVVDSSDDETVDILNKLSKEFPMKIIRQPLLGAKIARETALKYVNYKYVLIFDPDFIGNDKLKIKIKEFLNNHYNDKYYYLVYWPWIALCGDLSHRCNYNYHVEHWLFTWSRKLKYLFDGKIDYLYSPLYYKRIDLSYEPLGYHMASVKKPERVALNNLFRKSFYFKILSEKGEREAKKALEKVALENYGTSDLREIGLRIIKESIKNKPCFNYTELPREILNRAKELGIPFGSCS